MYISRIILSISLLLILFTYSCSKESTETNPTKEAIRSLDLSILPKLEALDVPFYDQNNQQKDVLTISKDNGVNVIRLRLWHSPSDANSSFEQVKMFSEKIKAKGLKVWLSVHYSDTWADPGHQSMPTEWEGISFSAMKDSVYTYTQKIVTEIQPDYIQIGNEINTGFLFPHGNIYTNENQFLDLISEGIQAIRDNSETVKIIIHYAGTNASIFFFDKMNNFDYDIIGISYYPLWHGKDLVHLENTLTSLKQTFNKKVLIAETAYPFTLGWDDWTNNIVGLDEQLILPDYPASIQGQKNFMLKIKQITENSQALGFSYWAAEWVAFDGTQSENGSPWENQALFDFNNKALPAFEAFNQ